MNYLLYAVPKFLTHTIMSVAKVLSFLVETDLERFVMNQ